MPLPLRIILVVVAFVVVAGATHSFWLTVLLIGLVLVANPTIRLVRKRRYFTSEQFQKVKHEIASVVTEHNEVADYIEEIRAKGAFELGSSSTGQHAHLATFENSSRWNNRRDRNVVEYAPHVHNASLQVVRNASIEPIKYVMKYFSITSNQTTLAAVQRVADDIARLEEAVANVRGREGAITAKINPPKFILKYYQDEYWNKIGVRLAPIAVPYPKYRFQYTSAGGNSGQIADVVLNTPTLEALSATLVEKIRWAKSAAGQRALMTNYLRGMIKQRDGFTCQKCGVSLSAEPHLLLEVDHIIPVSRGGLSVAENLQTLCWKCNRSKGARII